MWSERLHIPEAGILPPAWREEHCVEAKNNTAARILGWVSLSHTSAFDIVFVQLHFDMMTHGSIMPTERSVHRNPERGLKELPDEYVRIPRGSVSTEGMEAPGPLPHTLPYILYNIIC